MKSRPIKTRSEYCYAEFLAGFSPSLRGTIIKFKKNPKESTIEAVVVSGTHTEYKVGFNKGRWSNPLHPDNRENWKILNNYNEKMV